MARPLKVREGDAVMIIAGKDRGKTGRVLRTEPARQRVYVEGLNIQKRHSRPRSMAQAQQGEGAGILDQEGPVHVSNVMVLDPQDNKPTRVRVERDQGARRRVSARTGASLD